MILRALPIFLLLLSNTSALLAQNGYYSTGAGEAGMANASTAVYSDNIMFHNVGALASVDDSGISFGYDYRGFVPGLNNIYLQYIYSGASINTGISIYKTGDKYLNEFVGSLGFAHKLGIASIGVKVNYLQLYTEAFGYSRAASISAGVLADLSEQITVGAYLNNAALINFNREAQNFNIPILVQLGIAYKATDKLLFAASASKDLDYDLQVSTGIAYKIINPIIIRTGVNWYYKDFYYGLGLRLRNFRIDYALNPISQLGQVHSLTVSCRFIRKDEE